MGKKSYFNGVMAIITIVLFAIAVYRLFVLESASWMMGTLPVVCLIYMFAGKAQQRERIR